MVPHITIRVSMLLSILTLGACDQSAETQKSVAELNTKLDALTKTYADVGQREYRASLYTVIDSDRQQVVAYIHSARAIHVGEMIFVGDDVWQVEAAKIITEEYPMSPAPEPNKPKLYRPTHNELHVKFVGKARDAASKPEPQP